MHICKDTGYPFWTVAFVVNGVIVAPGPCSIGSNGAGSAVMVVQHLENEVCGIADPHRSSLQPRSKCSSEGGRSEDGGPWPHGGPIGAHLATCSKFGLPQDLGARRSKAIHLRVEERAFGNDIESRTALELHGKLSKVTLPPWSWHLAPPVACTAVHCSVWSQSVSGCQISAGTILAARWSFP